MTGESQQLWWLFGALLLDALVGDPDWLWRRLPHPVVLCGRLIERLDRWLNREHLTFGLRRAAGTGALAALLFASGGLGWLLEQGLARLSWGWSLELLLVAALISQRSLYEHVLAVAKAFDTGGLSAARVAVGHVVGRDPASLDEAAVNRASIESLAENFSDGVVAPALWYALLGLPGILAYKAANTMDSMIGHRTARYVAFGWAAARFDDLVNLPASRLASALLVLAALPRNAAGALGSVLRDAGRHRSPNAGWPEAAMAGALDLALAGPRRYGADWVEDAWMNPDGRAEAQPEDIRRALRLFLTACIWLWAAVAAAAWLAA